MSRGRSLCVVSFAVGALAPSLAAQLFQPAVGQPPFVGSMSLSAAGHGVLAVDVNADGHVDLVGLLGGIRVALNNGHGLFRDLEEVDADVILQEIAAGDLDGDGHVDLVTTSQTGDDHVTTFLGDGTGRFVLVQDQTVGDPRKVALADFDLDGWLDAVVAQGSGSAAGTSIHTLRGLGDGTLAAPVAQGVASYSHAVDAGDWNLDGSPDVLTGSTGTLRMLLGDGDGSFSNGPVVSVSSPAVALLDVDVDGDPDAVSTSDGVSGDSLVVRDNVAGFFVTLQSVPIHQAGILAVERDPADGYPDVAVGGNGEFGPKLRRLANTAGVYEWTDGFTVETATQTVAIADFDADGDADVLGGGLDDATIYFQQPDGALELPVHFGLLPTAVESSLLAVADLNGDGRGDLVVADDFQDNLHVAKGKQQFGGNGLWFNAWSTQPTEASPKDLDLADVNGDGALDAVLLASGGTSPDDLAVHLGTGAATFGAPLLTTFSVSTPQAFALGDLDADGLPDAVVLWTQTGATSLRSWAGTGTGLFAGGVDLGFGAGGVRVGLGDLDGDGFLDAVAVRAGAGVPAFGELLACAGDGAGNLGAPVVIPQDVDVFRDVLVRDFDGDGQADLVAQCRLGGSVALFRGVGAGAFAPPMTGGLAGKSGGGLIAADIDDDGALDVAHSVPFDAGAHVIRGDGEGGWHSVSSHPTGHGNGLRTLGVTDMNLDGLTDLVHLGDGGDVTQLVRQQPAANAWASLGGGLAGAAGQPRMIGTGEPVAGGQLDLRVDHAAPGAPAVLVLGLALLEAPFKGGTLVPSADLILPLPPTDAAGKLQLVATWPAGAPTDLTLWLQVFLVDPSAVKGLSATGGMRLDVP